MNYKNSDIRKSMDYIENIINRMGNNSFKIKSYSLALISIIVSISKISYQCPIKTLLGIQFINIIMLILDTCYLGVERYYRNLYDKARNELITHNNSYTPYYLNIETIIKMKYILKSLFSFNTLFYIGLALSSLFLI